MRNFIMGLLTAALIAGVAFYAYQFGKKSTSTNNREATVLSPTIKIAEENIVGGDRDEHGCIGSAGYTWCAAKNKCLRSWEESCKAVPSVSANSGDAEAIKQALVKKNNWPSTMKLIVTLKTNDGKYASGGVREEIAAEGGGYFFAIKDQGVWKIVADGNGAITCDELTPYPDYPKSLIAECYDQQTGKTVKR